MKRFLIFACLAALTMDVNAQGVTPDHHHEVGLNVSPLLTRIFNVSSFIGSEDDIFSLAYKYKTASNQAVRTQLGVQYSSSVDESQNDFQFSQWNTALAAAAGYEWRFLSDSRWIPFLGLDVVYQNSTIRTENKNSFDTTTTENEEVRVGGAGVLGCQFVINTRLRLATEASLLVNNRNQSTAFESENFPETNNSSSVKGLEVQSQVPLSLFLFITL